MQNPYVYATSLEPWRQVRLSRNQAAKAAAMAMQCQVMKLNDEIMRATGTRFVRPWMEPEERLLVKYILDALEPASCLEWGVGGSTIAFSKQIADFGSWISIEHDASWSKMIGQLVENRPNVRVYYVPPNRPSWSDESGDGSEEDLRDYIEFPAQFGRFDFILVDGRARVHCIRRAQSMLTTKGIIVLHDAGRSYYSKALAGFRESLLFTDPLWPHMGIWLASMESDVLETAGSSFLATFWYLAKRIRVRMRLVQRSPTHSWAGAVPNHG